MGMGVVCNLRLQILDLRFQIFDLIIKKWPSRLEGTEKPSVESLVLKKWHICGKKLAYVLFFLYLCGIFEK